MQVKNIVVSMRNQCQKSHLTIIATCLFETGKWANGSMVKQSAHHAIIMTSSKGKIRLSPAFNVI